MFSPLTDGVFKFSIQPIGVIHYDPLCGWEGVCGDDLSNSCGTIYSTRVTCKECLKYIKEKEGGTNG